MKNALLLVLTFTLVATTTVFAQNKRSKARVTLNPRKIHKLPVVDLVHLERSYPRSFLYRVDRTSVTLINRAIHNKTFEIEYFQGKLDLDQIKEMTIYDKGRRFKTNLIGAAIGGITGYFIGKSVAREDFNQVSIELLSQRPQTGFIEPILGTIVGASVGIAVGDLFTPIRLRDVHENPRKSSIFLRGLLKKKKKR